MLETVYTVLAAQGLDIHVCVAELEDVNYQQNHILSKQISLGIKIMKLDVLKALMFSKYKDIRGLWRLILIPAL